MAKFPVDPVPQYPLQITQNWKTIISTFDGGQEQRRRKLDFATYDVTLTFSALTQDEVDTLWAFYTAQGGAFNEFYFFVPYIETHVGLFVGVGDGTKEIFDIPGVIDGTTKIYFDGIEQAAAGYDLLVGGGVEGSDRVDFDTAPGAGVVISCDFTGYQRIRCRFSEDRMTKERFEAAIFKTGLNLKGLYTA